MRYHNSNRGRKFSGTSCTNKVIIRIPANILIVARLLFVNLEITIDIIALVKVATRDNDNRISVQPPTLNLKGRKIINWIAVSNPSSPYTSATTPI